MQPFKNINFDDYNAYFEAILNKSYIKAPYDKPDYFHYVEMNWKRQNRWFKNIILPEHLIQKIKSTQALDWYLITEPWCGDAAHLVPLIKMMADVNEAIQLHIVLRDENEGFMSQYLTSGSKSIPKLIMRNAHEDMVVWGPRPLALQNQVLEWKKEGVSLSNLKIVLQKWYNSDKGKSTFDEFMQLNF